MVLAIHADHRALAENHHNRAWQGNQIIAIKAPGTDSQSSSLQCLSESVCRRFDMRFQARIRLLLVKSSARVSQFTCVLRVHDVSWCAGEVYTHETGSGQALPRKGNRSDDFT